MKAIRKMYDWVLSWADSQYATPALFLLAFTESSFFPIPPDILLIAMAISLPLRAFKYAAWCTIGSLAGGIVGYGIGSIGYESIGKPIIDFYHAHDIMLAIKAQYDTYGFWGVLVAAITPIPYKVFTITSGFFDFSFPQFLGASIIGRSFRFFAVATLIWKYGAPIKSFIDKYFNILATAAVVLLILGFLLIKVLV